MSDNLDDAEVDRRFRELVADWDPGDLPAFPPDAAPRPSAGQPRMITRRAFVIPSRPQQHPLPPPVPPELSGDSADADDDYVPDPLPPMQLSLAARLGWACLALALAVGLLGLFGVNLGSPYPSLALVSGVVGLTLVLTASAKSATEAAERRRLSDNDDGSAV